MAKLADLVVELKAVGMKEMAGELEKQRLKTQQLDKAFTSGAYARFIKERKALQAKQDWMLLVAEKGKAVAVMERLQKSYQGFHVWAGRAFTVATVGLMGFIRAGLQGTAEGEVLSLRMQELSREIASVFLPTIHKVIDGIHKAVQWFRSLSVEQQDSVQKWTLIGLGVLFAIKVIGMLLPLLALLITHPAVAGILALAAAVAFLAYKFNQLSESAKKAEADLARWKQGQFTEEEIAASPLTKKIDAEKSFHMKSKRAGEAEGDARERARRAIAKNEESSFTSNVKRGWDVLVQGKEDPLSKELDEAMKEWRLARAQKAAADKHEALVPMGKEPKSKDHREVTRQGGQFEGVADTWKRIQSAASKTDMAIMDTATSASQIATNTSGTGPIVVAINNLQPGMAK